MRKTLVCLTVLGLLAMSAGPALAWCWWCDSGSDITVNNTKNATVKNKVTAEAYTGYNDANGGSGGSGGSGGDAEKNDNIDGDDQTNTGGNGGNGGNGAAGGSITTGNAYAKAKVINVVNTDYTDIDACGCCDCGCNPEPCECVDDIEVNNDDDAEVDNEVIGGSDTGENNVNGGSGSDGGDGGDAEKNDNEACDGCCGCADADQTNTGGDGGDAGSGGDAGTIWTGEAKAKAKTFNLVNTVITKVKR